MSQFIDDDDENDDVYGVYDIYDVWYDDRHFTNDTTTSTIDIMMIMVPYSLNRSIKQTRGIRRGCDGENDDNGTLFTQSIDQIRPGAYEGDATVKMMMMVPYSLNRSIKSDQGHTKGMRR